MYSEEYGDRSNPTVVMLHGAFFADSFIRQYTLSDRYHLIIPHIKGFGRAANEVFTADSAVAELKELIQKHAPVALVGFSLGAQLAFRLICETPESVSRAVLVSPWLVNKESISDEIISGNLTMLSQLKRKLPCNMIALLMGLSKQKRAEFVSSMQLISGESLVNCIDNKISIDSFPDFQSVGVPILALAGVREHEDVIRSVQRMAQLNAHCDYELWNKAKHNIPTMFAKKFNRRLEGFLSRE